MALRVRPGDLNLDEPAVVELFARYLNPEYDKARFDWLYRANPAGRGRLWVAIEEHRGEIVGTAAAFPRVVYVDGREMLGWVLGDFCVAGAYRALGPALMLQRSCLDALAAEPWYDFPAAAMMPIYRRLHREPVARISRQVKLLRVDTRLVALVPSPALRHGLAFVANRLLGIGLRRPRKAKDVTVALHDGVLGAEFSRLSARVASGFGFCLARSAPYLTWRYRENPTRRCEFVTARRNGELVAYAVVSQAGEQASLLDIFGVGERPVIGALLRGTLTLLRQRGCESVACTLLGSHPAAPLLKRLGFFRRESTPLMLSVPAHTGVHAFGSAAGGWLLIEGDSDG
jgi:hypothetical protein